MAAISSSSSKIPSLNSKDSSSVSAFTSRSISVQFPVRRVRTGDFIKFPSLSSTTRCTSPRPIEAKKQTYDSFEDLLVNSDKPVLVDYYATWCGPCQFMVPILDEVSSTLKDKIQVVKIDTEKYPSIANKYKIEALPTFILFKDGEPCDRFEGALTAKQLIQRIEDSLQVKP
ncbi:PREDICTED: thioredoxin Y1, chloroplastic-like isoform X2 [Camelina sativa]|uniref:Thioredoxin Y1, chloroplastic-like isoform X1 n=1 Tax=Camelina sativa TaxID=90675 RepID=A0ABM0TN08_CAMSA|nr:PREDICTED: thioredoxin Y1, chloroplastic-like isoform X1 [Camelina sativa]XP_010428744.1 PREDICTED: thioredoxin Y1, chloroplastic-like isoform X2 [Camelina sativa]